MEQTARRRRSPRKQRSARFITVLFLIALGLIGLMIAPFFGAFFAAAVLATLLDPLQIKLTRKTGGRPYLAAGLLTTAALFALIVPVGVLSTVVVQEGARAAQWATETLRDRGVDGLLDPLPHALRGPAQYALDSIPANLRTVTETLEPKTAESAPTNGAAASGETPIVRDEEPIAAPKTAAPDSRGDFGFGFSAAARAARQALIKITDWIVWFGVLLLAVFFLLAEGRKLVDYLVELAPLERTRTRSMLHSFRKVALGVFISSMVTSAAQAGAALVGFLIAGLPSVVLATFLTFACSFIPAIGGAGAAATAGILLAVSGRVGMGIFLIAWGFAVVGTIDNVVKPLVAKDYTQLSSSVVFFAMICGLAAFGPLGLIAGPLIAALFQIAARMLVLEREQRPAPAAR